MILKILDWLMLLVQVGLLAATAIVAPVRMQPRLRQYLTYSVVVGLVWFVFTVAAMFFDGATHNDVPGGGYLALGFFGWFVGSGVFAFRARSHKL
jgi:hypothetical protein